MTTDQNFELRPFAERAAFAVIAEFCENLSFVMWWADVPPGMRDLVRARLVDVIRREDDRPDATIAADDGPDPYRVEALRAAARFWEGCAPKLLASDRGVVLQQAKAFEDYLRGTE